jgi:predicted Zn finger-like uncharacterized protein
MALATQCPYCHTCFRVANDQLKLHAGIVRCGSCQQTFNGIAQLLSPEQTQDLINGKAPIPKEEKRPIPVKEVLPSPSPESSASTESQVTPPASEFVINTSAPETSIAISEDKNADVPQSNTVSETALHTQVGDENIEAIKASAISEVNEISEKSLIEKAPTPSVWTTAKTSLASNTSTEQKIEAAAPQVWQTRSHISEKSEKSENSETSITSSHDLDFEIDLPSSITQKKSTIELDFEFDEPITTHDKHGKNVASGSNLDFEIDEAPSPILVSEANKQSDDAHHPRSSELLQFDETNESATEQKHPSLVTRSDNSDNSDKNQDNTSATSDFIEELESIAAHEGTGTGTENNQEPNFDSNDFLALQKEAKNQEHIIGSELDKLDAKSNESLDEQLVALEDPTADEKPSFILHAERLEKRKRWRLLSYLVCFILCVTALAQTTYLFRNDIVAHYPSSKPHLQKACAVLKCSIQMPTQKEAFIFLADELITLSVEKNLFQLAVQLQNNSSTVQQWPHLLLTLNDQQGKPLLKRTFTPKEYLSDSKELQQGFAARTDIAIKLHFELKTINASNYRVEVIYP